MTEGLKAVSEYLLLRCSSEELKNTAGSEEETEMLCPHFTKTLEACQSILGCQWRNWERINKNRQLETQSKELDNFKDRSAFGQYNKKYVA